MWNKAIYLAAYRYHQTIEKRAKTMKPNKELIESIVKMVENKNVYHFAIKGKAAKWTVDADYWYYKAGGICASNKRHTGNNGHYRTEKLS